MMIIGRSLKQVGVIDRLDKKNNQLGRILGAGDEVGVKVRQ